MGGDGGPCVLKDNPATGGGKKGKKGLLTYMESHRVPQPCRAYGVGVPASCVACGGGRYP